MEGRAGGPVGLGAGAGVDLGAGAVAREGALVAWGGAVGLMAATPSLPGPGGWGSAEQAW